MLGVLRFFHTLLVFHFLLAVVGSDRDVRSYSTSSYGVLKFHLWVLFSFTLLGLVGLLKDWGNFNNQVLYDWFW